MRQALDHRNVVWLADHARPNAPRSPADDERPPPSPKPAAARPPLLPAIIDAVGMPLAA